MKIGFIGLGIMGSRMAANLQIKGYNLVINNRTKEKAEELIKLGSKWSDSPAEAVKDCDIVISMLSTPEVVKEIAVSGAGFIHSMNENSLWIDSSTVDPDTSKHLAEHAEQAGIRFIDAPVAGSLVPARDGQLVFLAGGNQKDIEEASHLFDIMGRKTIHAGGHGAGSSLKMVVNMLMAISIEGFCEGLHLGEALGLNKSKLLKILPELPVVAPIVKAKTSNFENEEFPPEFPLKWMHKDLFLALQCAFKNDIALPAGNHVKELYSSARQKGFGESDMSAIYKIIK